MADSRLNDLRRTWLASGRVEDEAALLREQLRVGELEQGQLELASYCAHPAASALTDAADHARPRSFGAWVRGLDDAGHPTRVCVALGALRAPPVRLGSGRQRIAPAARDVLRAGEAWLRCPCGSCASKVVEAQQRATLELESHPFEAHRRVDLFLAGRIGGMIARGLNLDPLLSETLGWYLTCCQSRLIATQVSPQHYGTEQAKRLRRTAEQRLWRRVQRYVAQWALGRWAGGGG